jgi:hypothetical protein
MDSVLLIRQFIADFTQPQQWPSPSWWTPLVWRL